jgi:hypothetical protein
MTTALKYVGNPACAGTDWKTIYTCPTGKTAIVKSVITANDSSIAASVNAYLGVSRSGVVTPLTGAITVTNTTAVNLLAGTLSLEANDVLVASTNAASRWKTGVTVPPGTMNRFEVNGITLLALTSTGIYRTTDLVTWTQVDPGNYTTALIAYIGTTWFVYTSATAARISTNDGLTWAAQAVTNAPYSVSASKTGGGIVKNGSTYAGIIAAQTAMTTTANGITWTLATAFPATVNSLVWTGTNYVASHSATDASVYYSTNGAAWTTATATGVLAYAGPGCLASNGAGVVVSAGHTANTASISVDHGATWSTLASVGLSSVADAAVIWTGSVFAVNSSTTSWQVSATGAAYTWGNPSTDYSAAMAPGFIYNGNVYKSSGSDIRISNGLSLPVGAGLSVTVSLMEVS